MQNRFTVNPQLSQIESLKNIQYQGNIKKNLIFESSANIQLRNDLSKKYIV